MERHSASPRPRRSPLGVREFFYAAFLLLVMAPRADAFEPASPEHVYLLVNSNLEDSETLALAYTQARAVPVENIIRLAMPLEETIDLATFIADIYNPLVRELYARRAIQGTLSGEYDDLGRVRYSVSRHDIHFLISCLGTPLRFRGDSDLATREPKMRQQFNRNNGAVDSELALIPQPLHLIIGAVPNPLFDAHVQDTAAYQRMIRVARLDGPSLGDALALIKNAQLGELNGLHGRALIDAGGPHATGDRWLEETQNLLSAKRWPIWTRPGQRRFQITDRADAVVLYFGWYTSKPDGFFSVPEFRFQPGAVGLHIHSFSASSVRGDETWTGALIARRVTATVGNVFEPFLEFSHQPQRLLEALQLGRSWGDAAYRSVNALSWQQVVIGDPLYTPFASGASPMDSAYRAIGVFRHLQKAESSDQALTFGMQQLRETGEAALAVEVADFLIQQGQLAEARALLKPFETPSAIPFQKAILYGELAALIHRSGDSPSSLRLFDRIIAQHQNYPQSLAADLVKRGIGIAERYLDLERMARWRTLAASMVPKDIDSQPEQQHE